MSLPNPEDLVGQSYRTAWIEAGGAVTEKTPAGPKNILESLGFNETDVVETLADARDLLVLAGIYEPNAIEIGMAGDVDGHARVAIPFGVYNETKEVFGQPSLLNRLRNNHPYIYKGLVAATVLGTLGLAAIGGSFMAIKAAKADTPPQDCSPQIKSPSVVISGDFMQSEAGNKTTGTIESFVANLCGVPFNYSVFVDGISVFNFNYKTQAPTDKHFVSQAYLFSGLRTIDIYANTSQASLQNAHYTTTIFVEDTNAKQLAMNQAPTLKFDSREKYFPTDPYGDDKNVSNNKNNYPDTFPKKPVIFYTVQDTGNKQYVEYWTHYVWNVWRGTDNHPLDNEVLIKEINKQAGNVARTSTSMHTWDNVYGGNVSVAFVENGSHGLSNDGKSFSLEDFSTVGLTLTPRDYDLKPLESLTPYKESGAWWVGDRGKFPTEQERYKNPESAFGTATFATSLEFGIKDSPNLELILKNPNVAAVQNGEIVYAVNNIGPGFSDAIAFKIFGVKSEAYRAQVKLEYKNKTETAEVQLSIKAGQTQYLAVNEKGLSVDKNNDGVPDSTVPFQANQASHSASSGSMTEKVLAVAALAGTVAAGVFGFRRRRDTSGKQ